MCELLWRLTEAAYCNARFDPTIWDIAGPAILEDPSCATFKTVTAPIFADERKYSFDSSRHKMLILEKLDRDTVYKNTWALLRSLKCKGEYVPRQYGK